ncbi:MAG TPA: hypothetical protein VFR18_19640, partial [Terriglobia bacterium]|nr:hypothetical protein [Terriglobia bacterium]
KLNSCDNVCRSAVGLALLTVVILSTPLWAAGPAFVEMTWMSIANMYYRIGDAGVVTDGYITRLPQAEFYGGGGGLAFTRKTYKPDLAAVTRVYEALGGPSARIEFLLTGHSHFDHSFDTATWSKLSDGRVIGSQTTCYQAAAEHVSLERCTVIDGGERIALTEGAAVYVVRWNHSGDPAVNGEQHNPVELRAIPPADLATGGLKAGVAEDFPNGGGARAFLFVVDGPDGRFSWFYQNSASAVDLHLPIVVDGRDYGAPIENLKKAMGEAKLSSVDLWIGTGGAPVARLVLPVLKPKAYLPIHWDGLWGAFEAGVPRPFSDAALETLLSAAGVSLIKPAQYMDKWRLDRDGIQPVDNNAVKKALGFIKD